MLNVLYLILATPFIILAKTAEFIVWDILTPWQDSHDWKPKSYINQDQGAYIQRVLKELAAQKRRNGELHDYYERERRKLIASFEREQRRRDELRHVQSR